MKFAQGVRAQWIAVAFSPLFACEPALAEPPPELEDAFVNRGPGGPAVSYSDDAIFENCAYLSAGAHDADRHNLMLMFDGYLFMPAAPKYARGGGLSFFDISDPCNPTLFAHRGTERMRETHSTTVVESDGRWYAVTAYLDPSHKNPADRDDESGDGGIMIWDLSLPEQAEPVAYLPFPGHDYPDDYDWVTLGVFWQPPFIYAGVANLGVIVVDASDPEAPHVVGRYQFDPVFRVGQVQAIGDLLVVTASEGVNAALLDISVPEFPQAIAGGNFELIDGAGRSREVYFSNVSGGYVFYTMKNDGGGLLAYDIHDPSAPSYAGHIDSRGNGGYVFVKDGLAFSGQSEFAAIYDVSDLTQISLVSEFELPGDLDTLTPIGNVAVLSVDNDGEEGRAGAIAPYMRDPDVTPPSVTWTVPDAGARATATSRIGLVMSEMIDIKSVNAGTVRLYETGKDPVLTAVVGRVGVQEAIINFAPLAPLAPGTPLHARARFRRRRGLLWQRDRADLFTRVRGGVRLRVTRRAWLVRACMLPCVALACVEEPQGDDTAESPALGDAPVPDAGRPVYAFPGERVLLDGSATAGAVEFQWDPGDGREALQRSTSPVAMVEYPEVGRYRPVLTAFGADGQLRSASVTITVTLPPTHVPRHSSTISTALVGETETTWVVAADADEVTEIARLGDSDAFEVVAHTRVCDGPRTVATWRDGVVVACQAEDALGLLPRDGEFTQVALPYGGRPYGVLVLEDEAWVTLQARGALARVDLAASPPTVTTMSVIEDARGLASLPDGRLAVTRWRSPQTHAELAVVDPSDGTVEIIELQYDPQGASDTEIGGVPSYLDQVLVSPAADEISLASLQANHQRGMFLSAEPLTFETTVRGIVSYLSWPGLVEDFPARKQFDNRGFMNAGVYSSRGDYLFLAARGNQTIERLDRFSGGQSGTISRVGYAPEGLALSPDDRYLYVDVSLSREVAVYDVRDFSSGPLTVVASLPSVSEEPLSPEVLRGKQLFNDSLDERISEDGYVACAHCHLDGEADRLTWDFTDRGEGLRNTTSLLGRAGTGHGPVHWSANFDEIQDFEHDLRGPFGGEGLMDDEHWNHGSVGVPLGDPKAGLSEDLDALAAYVTSLDAYPRSPYREVDGSLGAAAEAGRALFESDAAGCASCHRGAHLTDSELEASGPRLHDVGSLGEGSGQRLRERLEGIDTPTLHELWNSAPYLHDGSAPTLRDVWQRNGERHGTLDRLEDEEVEQLLAFLLTLEGPE